VKRGGCSSRLPLFLFGGERRILMSGKLAKKLTVLRLQVVREEVEYYGTKKVNKPADVEEVVRKFIGRADREMFVAVHLAADNKINSIHVVSVGSLDSSVVHPRECFKAALFSNAKSVVFAHNHPSGSVKPSIVDEQITSKLKKCGDLLDIKVLDHLIIGSNGYFSFQENALL